MSAETYPYHLAPWPLSDRPSLENGVPTLQGDIQREIDELAISTASLPMVTSGELDPWIMELFDWDGELASKSEAASQQYLQAWDGSFYDHPQCGNTQTG